MAVIVWLWDAGNAHGVTDDESRARKTVTTFMQNNEADSARVESATLVTGVRTLSTVYRRTGMGWSASRDGNGCIRWETVDDIPASLGKNDPSPRNGGCTGHATV